MNNDDTLIPRELLLQSVRLLLGEQRGTADARRHDFFQPDFSSSTGYEASLPPYRSQLKSLLGWPLTEQSSPGKATYSSVADDFLGRIYRVQARVLGSATAYGLLFLPKSSGRYPLVIALHGGLGTPELAAGLLKDGPANYNGLIKKLRVRALAIFAPQLLVWSKGADPQFDPLLLDREFKQLGGSRAAYDLCQLQTFLDALALHPEIEPTRIGMAGLSYGGFYTLYFSALEPRIRVAVSSCFVNDRYRYNSEDWVWKGSAHYFLDGEVAKMICPRPLFLEGGEKDELFEPSGFLEVAKEISDAYGTLGISDRFQSRIHPLGHEYDPDGKAEAFLLKWL